MKKLKTLLLYINISNKLPVILAILLYILIYFLRFQQGGWDLKLDLLQPQRQALDQRIASFLPSPQAEILSGILLGQNKNLPGKIRLALRDTSTIHIVVASGQNLSMVAGFILSLSGLIKRKNAIVLSFLAVIFYICLTGFQVPILRAAIMFILASLAQLFGRQRDGIWVLILTGGLMLLINPAWITNLSFQLSFLATIGVIVVSPIFLKYFKKIPLLGQDLSISLGAQLMVMPVIAQNFHQFSMVGLLTNLLILWTISFIMILGSAMLAVSLISQFLAQLIALAVSILLTYFIYIVEFFASLPFSWEYIGEQIWIVWLGYYMILAASLLSLNYGQKTNPGRP